MKDGIFTDVQLIDSIIMKLNSMPVTGVENCIKMVDVIQRLGALRKSLSGEKSEEAKVNDTANNG